MVAWRARRSHRVERDVYGKIVEGAMLRCQLRDGVVGTERPRAGGGGLR